MLKYLKMLCCLLLAGTTIGQVGDNAPKFQGMAIAGFNASQIEGDYAAGFKKLGFVGGVGAGYQLAKRWAVTLEMLYSMKGSTESNPAFTTGGMAGNTLFYELHYVEVPFYVSIMDWKAPSEKGDFMKIRANLGFSYGYMLGGTLKVNTFERQEALEDFYKRHDFNIIVGATFYFTKHWGAEFRYNHSILPMNGSLNGQPSFNNLLSFRGLYRF